LLKAEIATNDRRIPDYGPRVVGPAGATVIGARPFLIAYNLYLDTTEVEIAEKIARAVRHLSGGLRFVKGKGFLVDGRAQVSMNLTDFTKTPIARVQELVKREAERYGARVTKAELVGLIPQQALVDAAQWYLQLDNLRPEMILERQLSAPPAADADTAFIEKVAAGTPAPGGGAAGAYAGALAAGLCGMVARLTIGKKKYAEVEAEMLAVLAQADQAQAALTVAVADDSAAFEAVMAAFRLPKNDDAQSTDRAAAIQQAYIHAGEVPLQVVRTARRVLDLARSVVALGNVNALSDGASAAHLARACLVSAAHNVRINAREIVAAARTATWLAEIDQLQTEADVVIAEVEALVAQRRA
jgi:glutamate formiminotransferase/formiminotetrahydrofolate cyclodeaminase